MSDSLVPIELGDEVTIEVVDGLGHFLHLEDPALVNRHISEFLA